MDPISVAASILGLLGAAAKVSEVLANFIKAVKDAPKLARRVFSEVEDLTLCFERIQQFVNSEATENRSRAAMITVDQLLIVLTNCVTTFSELENALGGLTPKSFSVNIRLKWITKEHNISKLLQRLLSSKASLNLILTTLNCTRMQEAQEAIQSLANIVSDVLSNNQDIGRRLGNMDLPTTLRHRSAPSALEGMESMYEDLSLDGPNRNSYASSAATIVEERTERNSTFEQDLRTSRVYSKVSSPERRRSIHDPLPLQSSATDSVQSSTLSSLSLADVSDISMLSLPIAASALSNGQRYMRQSATNLVKTYQFRKFSPRSRPMTRVLLLGTSHAGKSTVLKQLQMMRGTKFTQTEIAEARHVLYSNLLTVFNNILQYHPTLSAMAQDLSDDYIPAFDDPESLHGPTLLASQKMWNHPAIGRVIRSQNWPLVPDNIDYIMQNLSKIFVRKSSQSFIACLYAHIETIGVYKCTLDLGPFDLEICDVGGARAMRKKLIHCMKDLDYAIYVADLNGYCQNLQEDLDANQMWESLQLFESLLKMPELADTTVFLFLNKADLFETTILREPISDYFPDYTGGADYWKGTQYFANKFAALDHRLGKKLHCHVTDSLDTPSFQKAWKQVEEKTIHTTLKF